MQSGTTTANSKVLHHYEGKNTGDPARILLDTFFCRRAHVRYRLRLHVQPFCNYSKRMKLKTFELVNEDRKHVRFGSSIGRFLVIHKRLQKKNASSSTALEK